MRRWILTLVLSAAAIAAIAAAPRLVSWRSTTPPLVVPARPATVPQVPIPEVVPVVVQPPVAPTPPEDFWRDAVDCGMG